VEKPRSWVVCNETERHVVAVRLQTKVYRVPLHRINIVVGAITRHTDDVKGMLIVDELRL